MLVCIRIQIPPTGYLGFITQYRYSYCKSQYCWRYYEGTLTLLWQKAEKLLHMHQLQGTLIVP